jgi:hypothetical protein
VWLCVNHRPKSACSSAGTGELPEDGTQVAKHVAATEWNNKTDKTSAFVGNF